MTREEAIKELSVEYLGDSERMIKAKKMAIKALEQEPIINKIRAEIKDWQTDIHDNEYDADKYDFVFERIFEIIDKYKGESEE